MRAPYRFKTWKTGIRKDASAYSRELIYFGVVYSRLLSSNNRLTDSHDDPYQNQGLLGMRCKRPSSHCVVVLKEDEAHRTKDPH